MADEPVNLHASYSRLNESLADQFDKAGVKRSFSVPYIDGQKTEDHIKAVGQAGIQSGGLSNNLMSTYHHASGKGWGHGEGETVGHPGDKLTETIIPKNDEHASKTIKAAQTHLNNIKSLLGDKESTVKEAQGQLDLVKKNNGAGMNLLHFGVFLQQIMNAPMQAVARAHSGTKDGGHAAHLRAPGGAQPAAAEPAAPGDQPAPEQESANAPAAPAAPGAPQAPAAPQAAPAAPAQG
jgi:hypothetical protein